LSLRAIAEAQRSRERSVAGGNLMNNPLSLRGAKRRSNLMNIDEIATAFGLAMTKKKCHSER
jgi:hypothetical protein